MGFGGKFGWPESRLDNFAGSWIGAIPNMVSRVATQCFGGGHLVLLMSAIEVSFCSIT